jgi:hypothetical protein
MPQTQYEGLLVGVSTFPAFDIKYELVVEKLQKAGLKVRLRLPQSLPVSVSTFAFSYIPTSFLSKSIFTSRTLKQFLNISTAQNFRHVAQMAKDDAFRQP